MFQVIIGWKQFCSVNGQWSKTAEVLCGILQGSCLGPPFLSCTLNGFESCLDFAEANMNEDNTHTTIASNNIYELIRTTKKELVHISGCLQGRIQSKFEGGAVCSGGAENFSEIGDECTMYSLCKETFHNNCCIL